MEEADVKHFDEVQSHIEGFHNEVSLLSKGKLDSPVSIFKLEHINAKLREANDLLTAEDLPLDGFKAFNADSVPTNSDVVFVLRQYLVSLENWRCARITYRVGQWYWQTNQSSNLLTKPPESSARKGV